MPSACHAHTVTKEHVAYCFDVLGRQFDDRTAEATISPLTSALFVTWNKIDRAGRERLRGCIGTLEPKAVPKALKDYALTSAFHDRRFPAMTADEMPRLSCTVSFLHSFEDAADWSDWIIGTHGLIVKFRDPHTKARRSATFLPEVAAGEAWSCSETLEHLIAKSGYHGCYEDVLPILEVTRYQSSAASMGYSEYLDLRNNASIGDADEASLVIPVLA